jgi:uncharacterized protein YegP (UPF0339 family)
MIEIRKDATEYYSFVLKAESGHALLNSVVYSNKVTAEEAVSSLQTIERSLNTIERKTNHNGKFLFSLKNNNGELIGNSLLYESEAGMENGIKNLMTRINSLFDSNQL